MEELMRIFGALEEAGFSHQEFDEDTVNPVNQIYNSLGVYIGDVLMCEGFARTEEVERGKRWTTFRKDNVRVSHRSFSEMPEARIWSII